MSMQHFYTQASGDATLDSREIAKIAESRGGALLAVDGIDESEVSAGKAQLPLKASGEQRVYLFYLEAADLDAAQYNANNILDTALAERNKPVYADFSQFLQEYPQAPWRDQLQAMLLYENDYGDGVDLLLFVPGQSAHNPAKIYYRGRAAHSCAILLKHFTEIPMKE